MFQFICLSDCYVSGQVCEFWKCGGCKLRSIVRDTDFWDAMATEERLKVVNSILSCCTLKGSYVEESRIIVHDNDVCLAIVVEQVSGYLLPWSLWQKGWYHRLCMVLSVFARGRACCDHVFDLFADTRPPNWLTGSFATFADSLVARVDFIQHVQTKGWGNEPWVFYQESSLERNKSSLWPICINFWVQLWLVRPSFGAELLQFLAHFIVLLVKSYLF